MASETATAPTTLTYGSATLYCYESTDGVYIDQLQTVGVDAFPFMLIYSGTGIVTLPNIKRFRIHFQESWASAETTLKKAKLLHLGTMTT